MNIYFTQGSSWPKIHVKHYCDYLKCIYKNPSLSKKIRRDEWNFQKTTNNINFQLIAHLVSFDAYSW